MANFLDKLFRRKEDENKVPSKNLGQYALEFGKNIFKSGANVIADTVGGLAEAAAHPIQTIKTIGKIGAGGIQSAPGAREFFDRNVKSEKGRAMLESNRATFDIVKNHFTNRYGDLDKLGATAFEDPLGFAADIVSLVTLGGGAVKQGAKFAGLSKTAQTAGEATRIAKSLDLTSKPFKFAGKGIEALSKERTIAPFGKQFDSEIAELAQKLKIDVPASVTTKSKAVPIIEGIVQKGLFGADLDSKIELAGKALSQYADDLIRDAGKVSKPTEVGESMIKGYNDFRDNFFKVKKELYDQASLKNENLRVPAQSSSSFLDELISREKTASPTLQDKAQLDFYEGLKADLLGFKKDPKTGELVQGDPLTVGQMKANLQKVGQKLKDFDDPIVRGNQANLRILYNKIDEDLTNTLKKANPELEGALTKADEYYKENIRKFEAAESDVLFANRNNPGYLLDRVIKPKRPDSVDRTFELIGGRKNPKTGQWEGEAVDNVRAGFLDKMISESRTAPDAPISGPKLEGFIKRYGDETVKKILTPEQYEMMQGIKELSQAFQKNFKITGGSQTAFIERLYQTATRMTALATAGGGAGFWMGGPIGAALGAIGTPIFYLLGERGFAKFITSEAGQQLLGKGALLEFERLRKAGEFVGKTPEELTQSARFFNQIEDEIQEFNAVPEGFEEEGDIPEGFEEEIPEGFEEDPNQPTSFQNAPEIDDSDDNEGMGFLKRLASAIGQFESGGRYNAIGPKTKTGDRAYGKYQVMGANIPQWTKQVLGRALSVREFLQNPYVQDVVAMVKMGQIFQKYGTIEDVASVWFSGKPFRGNRAKDVIGTSVPKYVSQVKALFERMG